MLTRTEEHQEDTWEDSQERRLKRVETKLTQLMLHLGMTPHQAMYTEPNPTAEKIFRKGS